MNNEIAHERLKLVVELRKASERYLEISRDFDNQADEINREIEAYYAVQNPRIEASEAVRRPASLQVMETRAQPSFERVAVAAAEDRERSKLELNTGVRRSPIEMTWSSIHQTLQRNRGSEGGYPNGGRLDRPSRVCQWFLSKAS